MASSGLKGNLELRLTRANGRQGRHFTLENRLGYALPQERWHGIANLDVLLGGTALEMKRVRKRLQPRRLTNRKRPVLNGMNVRTPVDVALCEDSAGEVRLPRSPIPFGVITPLRHLHAVRQQLERYISPRTTRWDMPHAFDIDWRQARC